MPKKRNRCRVKSCSVVIPDQYHFCYLHRKWSLADVKQEIAQNARPIAALKRFFCDHCGTVSRIFTYSDCRDCGRTTLEITT